MTDEDDKIIRSMWLAARLAGILSGAGFALAGTVMPDAVNMGIGVGLFVPVLVILAVVLERDLTRRHR